MGIRQILERERVTTSFVAEKLLVCIFYKDKLRLPCTFCNQKPEMTEKVKYTPAQKFLLRGVNFDYKTPFGLKNCYKRLFFGFFCYEYQAATSLWGDYSPTIGILCTLF